MLEEALRSEEMASFYVDRKVCLMERKIWIGMASLALPWTFLGCGAPAAPASVSSAPPAEAAPSETEASRADEAAPTLAGKPKLDIKTIEKSKALEGVFPDLDEVIKDIGAPSARGKLTRREWAYDAKTNKGSKGESYWYCPTIDVVQLPSNRFFIDRSILNGDSCKKVKQSEAQVESLLSAFTKDDQYGDLGIDLFTSPSTFDEANRLFVKKLGEPMAGEEIEFGSWNYSDENGECRQLFVTMHIGSYAGQAVRNLPCE